MAHRHLADDPILPDRGGAQWHPSLTTRGRVPCLGQSARFARLSYTRPATRPQLKAFLASEVPAAVGAASNLLCAHPCAADERDEALFFEAQAMIGVGNHLFERAYRHGESVAVHAKRGEADG